MSWLIYTSSHKIPLLFNYNIGLNLPGSIVVNQDLKLPTQSGQLVPRDDLCSLHDIFKNFLIWTLSVCFYSLVAYRPYHTLLGMHEFSIISWVASLKAFEFKIPLYSVPAPGHCTSPNMSRSKYMSIIYMSNTLSKTHVWVSPCRQKIHFLGLFSFHTCKTVCSYT